MNKWQESLRVDEYGGVLAEVPLLFLQHEGIVRLSFNVDTTTVEEAKGAEDFVNQLLSRLPDLEEDVATASFKYYRFLVEASRNDEGVKLLVA